MAYLEGSRYREQSANPNEKVLCHAITCRCLKRHSLRHSNRIPDG